MRNMKRVLWSLATLGAIAAALLFMLGMFWVVEIAPLVLFVAMAIAYGLLSSSRTPKSPRTSTNVSQIKDRSHSS